MFFRIFIVTSSTTLPASSTLLLRDSPNTFAFIPLVAMSLSSRNRNISNTFRHILPCVAPLCKGMHYHKTGVPWQMNKTLIINFSCCFVQTSLYCQGLRWFVSISGYLIFSSLKLHFLWLPDIFISLILVFFHL